MNTPPQGHWTKSDKRDPSMFWMALRGLVPKVLGGEMVYDAVVSVNHFNSTSLLRNYLTEQSIAACARGAEADCEAIEAHLKRIRHEYKAMHQAAQQ